MKRTAALALSLGRPPLPEPRNRVNQLGTGVSTRSDIYARPDIYDMEHEGASNHDARFFARLLARVRPSSIDMLAKAATARDAAEPLVRERVSLVEGDMRDWPGTGDAFDAVVIACCSVSHLLTLDDRRRTWATAFRLLRPGGVFILDVRVPTWRRWPQRNACDRARSWIWTSMPRRTAGEEAHLLRCTTTTYEPHLQRADVRLLYDRFDQCALAELRSVSKGCG